MNNKEKGKLGEKIACKYLRSIGVKVIDTNYQIKSGEIDIISKLENEIIFIEVKTRSNLKFGYPSEAVTCNKIKKIVDTAKYYIFIKNLYHFKVRFDVIEIYLSENKINHITNAF